MPDAPVLGASETVSLDDDVFGAAFNGPLVHETVLAELAADQAAAVAQPARPKVVRRLTAGSSSAHRRL